MTKFESRTATNPLENCLRRFTTRRAAGVERSVAAARRRLTSTSSTSGCFSREDVIVKEDESDIAATGVRLEMLKRLDMRFLILRRLNMATMERFSRVGRDFLVCCADTADNHVSRSRAGGSAE